MSTSKLDIINAALARLGTSLISSLTDQSERGKAIELVYNSILKSRMAGYPWRFTIREIELNQVPDTDEGVDTRFQYHYIIPNTVFRPLGLTLGCDYSINGTTLNTNDDKARMVAIMVQDEGNFPEWFRLALEYQLASEMAPSETEDNTRLAFWKREATTGWSIARTTDSKIQTTPNIDRAISRFLHSEPTPRY